MHPQQSEVTSVLMYRYTNSDWWTFEEEKLSQVDRKWRLNFHKLLALQMKYMYVSAQHTHNFRQKTFVDRCKNLKIREKVSLTLNYSLPLSCPKAGRVSTSLSINAWFSRSLHSNSTVFANLIQVFKVFFVCTYLRKWRSGVGAWSFQWFWGGNRSPWKHQVPLHAY